MFNNYALIESHGIPWIKTFNGPVHFCCGSIGFCGVGFGVDKSRKVQGMKWKKMCILEFNDFKVTVKFLFSTPVNFSAILANYKGKFNGV